MTALFIELGIVIIAATIFALVTRVLKQPTIIGYILAGIVIGPAFLGLVQNHETIMFFSELGVVFLLFIVGLELNITKIQEVGKRALFIGLAQVLFTFVISFGIARYLGFNTTTASFLGIILTLSSTIVVIKLYSDKRELATLHGRVALGILLIQDIVAVGVLLLLAGQSQSFLQIGAVLNIIGLILIVFVLSKLILPKVFDYVAKWPEVLFITSLGWCFIFVMVAKFFNVSVAIGALLAGISLSQLVVHHQISARTKPLRDFFATIFFVSIGMQIVFTISQEFLLPIIVFTAFVVLGSPIVILLAMSFFGFRTKSAFLTAIGLGQISEFSLIIAAVGVQTGIIGVEIISITAIIAVLTFMSSAYFITYDDSIYRRLAGVLKPLDKLTKNSIRLHYGSGKRNPQYIIFGAHRIGTRIINTLRKQKKKILVIDFDPEVIKSLMRRRIQCMYGDVEDSDILREAGIDSAKMIISTIPSLRENRIIIQQVRRLNKNAAIIVTAENTMDAIDLYKKGAHYVILPKHLSGTLVSKIVERTSIEQIIKHKSYHHNTLRKTKSYNKYKYKHKRNSKKK